jgi:hypothetical protein
MCFHPYFDGLNLQLLSDVFVDMPHRDLSLSAGYLGKTTTEIQRFIGVINGTALYSTSVHLSVIREYETTYILTSYTVSDARMLLMARPSACNVQWKRGNTSNVVRPTISSTYMYLRILGMGCEEVERSKGNVDGECSKAGKKVQLRLISF